MAAVPFLVGAAGAALLDREPGFRRCRSCEERDRRRNAGGWLPSSATARRVTALVFAIIVFVLLVHLTLGL